MKDASIQHSGPRARAEQEPSLLSVVATLALVLLVFQNLPLSQTPLGGFGAAASMPLIGFGVLLATANAWVESRQTEVNPIFCVLLLYVSLVTVVGIAMFGFEYRGSALVTKAALAGIQVSFFISAFFLAWAVPRSWIAPAAGWALAINIVGLLLIRGGTSEIDFNDISFSSEPSHFGFLTVVLSLLFYYFCDHKWWRWGLLGSSLLAAILSGSKGALAGLALAALITVLVKQSRRPRFLLMWGTPLLVVCGVMLFLSVEMLSEDLESFSSVATRSAGAITAVLIGLQYPFGVGLGGFYPGFSAKVPQAWDVLTAVTGSGIDLSELFKFAYSDDRNLSSKSLFGDVLIYFGWPGVALLAFAFGKLYRRSLRFEGERSLGLALAVCFCAIATLTYYVGIPFYILPISMGLIWREVRLS